MDNYKRYFDNAIRSSFPGKHNEILVEVESHYHIIEPDVRFAKTSHNPIDKRLDFSAYFLALIKVMDAHGEPYNRIRAICLSVVTEYVRPKNRFQSFVKRLPPKLIHTWVAKILLKQFNRKVSKPNKDGFVATIITDKKETFGLGYGVDIIECGICKLFHKHRSEKYASILCEVDELTAGLAGLKLVRTGTIALGADKCDFRFKKVK